MDAGDLLDQVDLALQVGPPARRAPGGGGVVGVQAFQAEAFDRERAGKSKLARIAITATTTSSSIKVNPLLLRLIPDFDSFVMNSQRD